MTGLRTLHCLMPLLSLIGPETLPLHLADTLEFVLLSRKYLQSSLEKIYHHRSLSLSLQSIL